MLRQLKPDFARPIDERAQFGVLHETVETADCDVDKAGDAIEEAELQHIETDEAILGGEPIIRGSRTPVRAIVELWRLGISAEEIPSRLPYLTLAQVFDALSYYSDHQEEINSYIERNRIPDELIDPLVKNL